MVDTYFKCPLFVVSSGKYNVAVLFEKIVMGFDFNLAVYFMKLYRQ